MTAIMLSFGHTDPRWHGKIECPYNAGETNDFVSARWFLQDKAIFVLLYAGKPET